MRISTSQTIFFSFVSIILGLLLVVISIFLDSSLMIFIGIVWAVLGLVTLIFKSRNKPTFQKWAKREIKRIRQDSSKLNTGDAYLRAAKLSNVLGKRYSKIGKHEKAKGQFKQASEIYKKIGK
tara:strand:+ start:318 stop:686 length:369 start_codon:yes stop_codon:yes gene_type:complete